MLKAFSVLLILCSLASAQLPETPVSQVHHVRRNFWIAHAAALGAVVYDEEITHEGLAHHKCVEGTVDPPTPSRADLYKNGLVFLAAFTAMDYLFYRTVGHGSQYVGAAGTIIKHVHGGTQWFTEGCW